VDAAAQQAPLAAAREHVIQGLLHLRQPRAGVIAMQRVELLLRKIERRLGDGAQLDQLRLQAADRA
jgi:hypothetical protein